MGEVTLWLDAMVVLTRDDEEDQTLPCGCTPWRECDAHWLDAERDYERRIDV